jgi:hypothetical protein
LLGYREDTVYFSSNFSADEHVGINCGGIGRLKLVFSTLRQEVILRVSGKEALRRMIKPTSNREEMSVAWKIFMIGTLGQMF